MNWTDERVDLLRKLWGEGLSASQIAAQIGGVSRNAVIGKVHRMKLSNQGRAAAPGTQKKTTVEVEVPQPAASSQGSQTAARAAVAAAAVMRPVTTSVGATALQAEFDAEPIIRPVMRPAADNVVVPISRRLRLVQLTERTCKWPNGDPLAEDFSFCGNDCGENGPYCRYHARIAFQPASERRRIR